jgi:hypothetical protein
MFSIHDRVSWDEKIIRKNSQGYILTDVLHHSDDPMSLDNENYTGTIVAEELSDHYRVKRDSDGKCQVLCYRKLRLIDGD